MHKKWSFPLRIPSVNMTKFPALFPVDLVTFTEQILNTNFNFCEGNPSYQWFWKNILSSEQDMKFGWFHKFLFYDLYFEFNSLNALNIYYLTIHLYIHCNNISIHKLCFFFVHYCRLRNINTSLASIKQIFQLQHHWFYLSFF